jgi:hypothetical protein
MIEKEYVPYELALELKQLQFDEPCISNYTSFGKFSNDYSAPRKYNSEFELGSYISAPTYSQAFRFFREKYGLDQYVRRVYGANKHYVYKILKDGIIIDGTSVDEVFPSSSSHEEAELACLKYLIKTVKENENR